MNFADQVTRIRAGRVTDPYNPGSTVEDWTNTSEKLMTGFFDSFNSAPLIDPVRNQVINTATFFLPDLAADIRYGDRVRHGDSVWLVTGFADAPKNPFTGWQPYKAVKLQEVLG